MNVSNVCDSIQGIKNLKVGKNILPVQVASVLAIAFKISAEGFNNPSWII